MRETIEKAEKKYNANYGEFHKHLQHEAITRKEEKQREGEKRAKLAQKQHVRESR